MKNKVMMWNTPWPAFCPKYSANQPVHTKPNRASETEHIHFSSFGTDPKISYLPWDIPSPYVKRCWIMTQTLTEIWGFSCVIFCLDKRKIRLYFHRFSIFILFYKMCMIIVGFNLTAGN